jgi:hypothetical protein
MLVLVVAGSMRMVPPVEPGRISQCCWIVDDIDVEIEALRVVELALLGIWRYESPS